MNIFFFGSRSSSYLLHGSQNRSKRPTLTLISYREARKNKRPLTLISYASLALARPLTLISYRSLALARPLTLISYIGFINNAHLENPDEGLKIIARRTKLSTVPRVIIQRRHTIKA